MNAMTRRMEEASEWLIRLEEEDLAESEIARWVEWCDSDPENRRAFERLWPLWQAFDPAATRAVNGAVETVTPRAEAGRSNPGAKLSSRRARLAVALAASVVVAVCAGVLLQLTADRPKPVGEVSSLGSAPAQHRVLTLPDGSGVELGARSAVKVDFKGNQRRIELSEGEAFFTVKHDKERPFIVIAGDLHVVAVGTAFDVLRAGHRVTVTVQEGIVDVSAGHSARAQLDAAPSQSLRVPQGSQVVYDAAQGAGPTLRSIDVAATTTWREGRLEYVGEPLASVVATLNRYASHPVRMEGAGLDSLHYTGTIEVRSVDEWLRALPHVFPVEVKREADGAITIMARGAD
ncbi:MAG: FecR domain-containing protein [Gammaproteobacteria bacterium]